MIDIILSVLKKLKIENYIINDTQTESVELFFIRKILDMRRCKDVHTYNVTVFNDFEKDNNKKRGSSSAIIHPSMTEKEIEVILSEAYYSASFVSNPYFKLPSPCIEPKVQMKSSLSNYSLAEVAGKISEALFAADIYENTFINSAEIFVNKITECILSSEGTDVGYTKYNVNGEFVAQCISPQDVELHETFSYDDLETTALTQKVKESLKTVEDRASATKAPVAGEYTIILSGKHIREVLSYYLDRSAANMIYAKYSKYSIGTHIQGDNIKGEALNINVKASTPYSIEGIKFIHRQLIKDGELKLIHGNNRFCQYLGIESTGHYSRIEVDNGTVSFDSMKKNKSLHIVSFSDFQMDPFSGHFGGEIRLAYLYDGNTTSTLTGGSINGSLLKIQDNLTFSTERYVDSNYDGPYAIMIENVSVAGI